MGFGLLHRDKKEDDQKKVDELRQRAVQAQVEPTVEEEELEAEEEEVEEEEDEDEAIRKEMEEEVENAIVYEGKNLILIDGVDLDSDAVPILAEYIEGKIREGFSIAAVRIEEYPRIWLQRPANINAPIKEPEIGGEK